MKNSDDSLDAFVSMEGKLLLADTALRDVNFFRSVLYVTRHTTDGAHAYILNQPLDRQVNDLLAGEEFALLADVPVFKGGPVGVERLTFATLGWNARTRVFHFRSHLSTSEACDAHLSGQEVRAFVGHSGWSAGQMERELQGNSWMVADVAVAGANLGNAEQTPNLWSTVLCAMGPFHTLLALTPEWPERN